MLLLILLILPLPETVIKCDMLAITLNFPQMVKRQFSEPVIFSFRRALPNWIWTMWWQRSNFLHLQRIKLGKSIFKQVTLQPDHLTLYKQATTLLSSFLVNIHKPPAVPHWTLDRILCLVQRRKINYIILG